MTTATEDPHALHRLLLWADSALADDVVTATRSWLAAGLHADVASAVAFAAMSAGVVPPTDGGRPATVPAIVLASTGPRWPADGPFGALDLTGDHPAGAGPDAVDRGAIELVRFVPDAVALWRSWRFPAGATRAGVDGTRGYLVRLVDDAPDDHPPTVAAWMQANVAGPDPLIRVYRGESELPVHQRMALDRGALLWTRQPARPLRIAGAGAAPPTPTERAYLHSGVPVLLDPDHHGPWPDPAGPPMIRTDGTWVWSDSQSTVDVDLAEHIQLAGTHAPDVDDITVRRAVIAVSS
ncbi:hypothetical protein [Virgisporangium aurantiacum]|uniref:Uncharacterized protein n=1 Tax=Virgisporangium aurantiacum TaxID=175570 RepID=A0A8J4E5S4_9ACTN|nr:hypothetical protein [Virgisporangium aurantiacum]GIJ62439.1 hypothetical protein Vau01_099550 [Virgisporangium aurantiacum]